MNFIYFEVKIKNNHIVNNLCIIININITHNNTGNQDFNHAIFNYNFNLNLLINIAGTRLTAASTLRESLVT